MEKQVHVSFYASLFRTECKVLTLEEIIILIRRRRWKNEILAYRTALAEGRAEEARKLKGGLPGFTPSGVFKGGHKASAIETYSQVVGLDFDHVKDLPALILAFRALSSTLAMFVSPGGEGLKVFVRVDCPAERHGEAYPLSPPSSRRQAVWQAMPSARTSAVAATWATTGRRTTIRTRKSSTSPKSSRPKRVSTRLSHVSSTASRRWQERVTRRSTASAARRTGGAFRTPKQPHAARCACKRQTSRRQRSNRRYILLIKEI